MDLASYQTLSNVIQTTYAKTSQVGRDQVFLTVRFLGFVSKNPDVPHALQSDPQYKEKDVIKLIVNTTVSDRNPDSRKNSLRLEAMDVVKAALVKIGNEYKEAAKKEIEIKKQVGSKFPFPKKTISFNLLGETMFDDITLTQATMYSTMKTGTYRFEIIADVEK